MAERHDERYRGLPYRGEHGYAREARGFGERSSNSGQNYGHPSERGWRSERWEAPDRWGKWRDRDYEARRRGYGGETGRDTSWSGPSSSAYGPYGSRYHPSYESGDHDEWREGPFGGRGPKGYQRPDSRIHEDVCDRLTASPDIDATNVEVTVKHGEVTLSGLVRNRDEKRASEDVSEGVSGVREVHNNLRVSRAPEGPNVGP